MKKLILLFLILTSQPEIFSQDGFRIKQISNLNLYPQFGEFSYSALWGYTSSDGREYAILGCFNGTSFIDITDTNNVYEVDFLGLPPGVDGSAWREMKTYSHYCYIVTQSFDSKIQMVDLQYLPDSIRYIGLSNLPGHSNTHTISQSGHYLYLNGANASLSSGVAVVDLINPEVPVLRGKWNDVYVHDSRIINDTIWACNIFDGKVSIIDATNKDSLRNIRSWVNNPLPNSPHNIAFTNDGNYAFVANELGTETAPGNLKVWNVSDLDDITLVNIFNPYPFDKTTSHNVEIYNNYAFIAYYSAGVKVLNISNPVNPVEIGWFDTYPDDNGANFNGCWGIYYFPSGKIIASDRKRGLFVLKPNLSNQISTLPKVNFIREKFEVERLRTIRLIDMTEGLPTNWNWTVTGPEIQTSGLKNPDFIFNLNGFYTVKLKASNSLGTDSVIKTDYFRVIYAPLINFQVVNPVGIPPIRILTSPVDTSRVFFNWQRSMSHPDINYNLHFKKILGTTDYLFPSGNNGSDTFYFARKSFLDSMAIQLGLTGDSVRVSFRAIVYNGQDSLSSQNSITLTIRRTTVGIQTLNELIPIEFKLHNNYPNPFNPVTKINFDIPNSGKITLKVFDINGREVTTLLNEFKPAGFYSADFDGSNLSSGVYFYSLETENFVDTKKLVLLK